MKKQRTTAHATAKSASRNSFWKRVPVVARRFGFDWFILALLGMILLAYLWSAPGVQEGFFSLSSLATYGVSVIFFFYGLRLNADKLRSGLSNWRLHLIVQAATFIIFPLLVLAARFFLQHEENEWLWIGVFFLAALPSTVSSAVVMVSIAKGNIPAAIFNASISSLLGVFLTPLWMGLVMQSAGGSIDFGTVVGKLALQVLVPVVLGLLLNQQLGRFAERYRQTLKYFDQMIILLIVYTSFCESFAQKMFEGYRLADLLILAGGLAALFAVVYCMTSGISRLLHFSREDTITVAFCGSKKSLVHGSVMAQVLFTGSIAGVVLLPVMIYHAMQLIAASIIAQSMAQHAEQPLAQCSKE